MDYSHIQWECDMNELFHIMILQQSDNFTFFLTQTYCWLARGLWLEVCIQNRSSEQFYHAVPFPSSSVYKLCCCGDIWEMTRPLPQRTVFLKNIRCNINAVGWLRIEILLFLSFWSPRLCAWNAEVINFSWHTRGHLRMGECWQGPWGCGMKRRGGWH